MRAVTRGTGALTQGEDAGWSGVSVWGSRWWWFTLLIWIKPLVMTDKNIKMSCDQCPLPGAGSGEIGIRVPSSRHLNWVRETGSREIISGAREYWLHFRGCTQHTSMMRGMCLWHGDPIRKDSLFPLWSLQKQISFYFPLFPSHNCSCEGQNE